MRAAVRFREQHVDRQRDPERAPQLRQPRAQFGRRRGYGGGTPCLEQLLAAKADDGDATRLRPPGQRRPQPIWNDVVNEARPAARLLEEGAARFHYYRIMSVPEVHGARGWN